MATAKRVVAAKSDNSVHIYSTLANPQAFSVYVKGGEDLQVLDRQVFIKGGAGIASKNLITAMGVHTAISEDDYNAIKDLPHFKHMIDKGHIVVERKKAADIEAVVGDMNAKDPGGPITPADYEAKAKDGSEAVPMSLLDKKG